jgi:hypothetical protein
MRFPNQVDWVAPRHPDEARAAEAGTARLMCRPWLPLCLLTLALGCGSNAKYETAEVTGKVLYKDKVLPGGKVTFIADQGGLAMDGTIDENGNYRVKAPVGPVHITVDNRLLAKHAPRGRILKGPKNEEPSSLEGDYVDIPKKYYSVDKTDLTYTVAPGSQAFEINLK